MILDKLFLGTFILFLCFSNIHGDYSTANLTKLYQDVIVEVDGTSTTTLQSSTPTDALSPCLRQFNITVENAYEVSFSESEEGFLTLAIITSENTAVESVLYYIEWKDELSTPPHNYDNDTVLFDTALEYEEYTYDDYSLSTTLVKSMWGIADYTPDDIERAEFLLLTLYFEFNSSLECTIEVRQTIEDYNSQTPEFTDDYYDVMLKEDYPALLTIPGLQLIAYDYDGGYPNNWFSVNMSEGCVLQPLQSSYVCDSGNPVFVEFNLMEMFNYEDLSVEQHNCTVTLQDGGEEPLSSSAVIYVEVLGVQDEVPVFTQNFYVGDLVEMDNGTFVVLIIANDPDIPSTNISYMMTATVPNVGWDDYFSIDSETGEVAVTQDLDEELLSWKRVSFFITACDEGNQCSKSILTINLPYLNEDIFVFERATYPVQVISPTIGQPMVDITAVSSNYSSDVRYSFVDDGSPGLQFFEIDEETGLITTTQNDTRIETFVLTANATDGHQIAKTTVIIEVLLNIPLNVILKESIAFTAILEDTLDPVYTVSGVGATSYCILDVEPAGFEDYFWIGNNGMINLKDPLDADTLMGNSVTIKTGAYLSSSSPCNGSDMTNYISNNEMLVELQIKDVDDIKPNFVNSAGIPQAANKMVYAYPEDPTLQKVIGPVAKIMAKDMDISQEPPTYSLHPTSQFSDDGFEIDFQSGDIYLTGSMQETTFFVEASGSRKSRRMLTQIKILPSSYISTMYFDNVDPNDIDREIAITSQMARLNIYLLYYTVISLTEQASRVQAHVYCIHDGQLIDWEQLKDYLDAKTITTEVTEFSDEEIYFLVDNDDFKTSTIVLGVLTGLLVIVAIGFVAYIYMMKKKK